MLEEDDFEYDDDIFCDVNRHTSPVPQDLGYHGRSLQDEMACGGQAPMVMDLRCKGEEGGASGGDDTRHLRGFRCPPLSLSAELHHLLKDMSSDEDDVGDGDIDNKHVSARADVDDDVMEMTCDSNRLCQEEKEEEEDAVSRQSQHHLNEMLQAQQSRIDKLERRVQELECRVQELQQERDKLQDVACGHVTAGHVLQQTRSERDNAISRLSVMEGELSRMTREVVTLNSQLMDTVRRKVRISQELDQWQIDLSEVLAVQMQRRVRERQKAEKNPGAVQKQGEVWSPSLGEDLHSMESRIGILEIQIDYLRAHLASQRDNEATASTKEQLAESQKAVKTIKDQMNNAMARLRQRETLLRQREEELQQDVHKLTALREADQKEMTSLRDLVKNLKGQLAEREARIKALDHRLRQTQYELDTTRRDLKHTSQGLAKTQGDLQTACKDLRKTKDTLTSTQKDLNTTKTKLNTTQDKLSSMEVVLNNVVADVRSFKYGQCSDDVSSDQQQRQQQQQHQQQQQQQHEQQQQQQRGTAVNQSLTLPPLRPYYNFPPQKD
ncbi:hypothetical protein ACOMHN_053461 [Nucella lapillus]